MKRQFYSLLVIAILLVLQVHSFSHAAESDDHEICQLCINADNIALTDNQLIKFSNFITSNNKLFSENNLLVSREIAFFLSRAPPIKAIL